MSLRQLTEETGLKQHQVRYAANALVSDDRAHIHHVERVICSDGVERDVSFYAAGLDQTPRSRLDYASTSHLQDLYQFWTSQRNEVPEVQGSDGSPGDPDDAQGCEAQA